MFVICIDILPNFASCYSPLQLAGILHPWYRVSGASCVPLSVRVLLLDQVATALVQSVIAQNGAPKEHLDALLYNRTKGRYTAVGFSGLSPGLPDTKKTTGFIALADHLHCIND